MRRLLSVELTRLRWRRAVVVLLVVAAVVPVLVLALTAWNTRPVSAGELREAERIVAEESQSRHVQRDLARCERNPGRYGVPDATECREMLQPQVAWFLPRRALDVESVLRSEALAVVIFVTGLLMLAGTTFVGADWTSGSMSNQLLFEPRRGRIWGAKAAVVALVGAGVMALAMAVVWGGVAGLVATRGLTVPAGVVDDAWAFSGRAVALCAGACLGAYAVTMLFRSTVFTLGGLFALTILSVMVLAVLGLSERWMPQVNVAAVLFDGVDYFREPPAACWEQERPPDGLDCSETRRLPLTGGVTYLGVALAAAVTASVGAFLRRDVP